MRTFAADIRWALRLIRHRPAFASIIVLTLAGAVAAVTIAVGVATAVLWRPLPFAHADRLAFVWENTGTNGGSQPARVTGYRFDQWQLGARTLNSLALFGAVGYLADTGSGRVILNGVRVSTNYFATLGIAPALGRDFVRADGESGAANVVILSDGLWKEWLGGRVDAIGTTVYLANRPFVVIGVMPAVVFPAWPGNSATVTLDPDSRRLWTPILRTPALAANARSHVYGAVARIADGRTLDEAAGELTRMAQASDPDAHGAMLRPFRGQFVRDARLPLIALVGAALAMLLIGCANLAALHGSAMESRRAELAVRAALGAGRTRLVRQLATEAVVLALGGVAIGIAVARLALARLPALLPPSVPLLTVPSLDARTLLAAAVVSALATIALAAWPIARTRTMMSRGVMPIARTWGFRGLVIGQVAVSMAVAASAALLQQSLDTVRGRDAGFTIDNVLVANLTLAGAGYNSSLDRVVAAERRLTEDIARLPGARGVAVAYDNPLEAHWIDAFSISGSAAAHDDTSGTAQLRIVSPSYFDTMGVPIVAGRGFSERDGLGSSGVALVNRAFADRVFDGPLLNRTIRSGSARASTGDRRVPDAFRIVGIVANERFRGLEQPSEPAVYLSTRQFPQLQPVVLIHTAVDPRSLAGPVRSLVRAFDADIVTGAMTTVSDLLAEQLVTRRSTTHVIDGFAAASLALAALGLYGLLSLVVSARVRETGIRLALGSSPRIEARRIVRDCLAWTGMGIAGGVALAVPAGRLVQTLLVEVSPHDGHTLALTAALIVAAALAAAVVPAWRAARVDPAAALRA